jgi:4-hydroxy-3-polyprenylbenzoate decarboxylase
LSLAKFLFITADDTNQLSAHNTRSFMEYVLERIDFSRDIHFHTNTTIDTLDYSGTGLNSGSKVVIAAYGEVKRKLAAEVPAALKELSFFRNAKMAMPGVVAMEADAFSSYQEAAKEMDLLNQQLQTKTDQLNELR